MKKLFLLPLFIGGIGFAQVHDSGDKVGIGLSNPLTKLEVYKSNVPAIITIRGGLNSQTTVGNEIGSLDFRSNDASILSVNDISGRIVSVAEYSNGAWAGLAFYTADNTTAPYIREKMRLDNLGNLGLGTTLPAAKLDVIGNVRIEAGSNHISLIESDSSNKRWDMHGNTSDFLITEFGFADRFKINNTTGNVSIGNTSDTYKLDVSGEIRARNTTASTVSRMIITNSSATSAATSKIEMNTIGNNLAIINYPDADTGNANRTDFLSTATGSYFSFSPGATESVRFTSDGNVGIGITDTQGFKLGVNGKIAATEVKVATYANWPDYVFNKDYDLPTLKEVEQHIEDKGHLKNIPNAEEVKKEGFFLGDMDSKLLQKIEELTLYTIEQEKELQNQKAINKNLEDRLQKIEALLAPKN